MLKARESVFWPGISDDIWETVEKCGICQSTSRAPKPVGNISEIPPHPWHTLGTDPFYWNRIEFLVVGDYFTKFLIIRKLPNTGWKVPTFSYFSGFFLLFPTLGSNSYFFLLFHIFQFSFKGSTWVVVGC